LKRIANLNKSLKIQEESIKSYPEDMISKEEYEEVLKANADLNKSLENYEKLTGNLLKMLLQIQFMRVPSRNWQK
jgi:hypothetical protein